MHNSGAAQPGIEHHQIPSPESHRLTAIWGNGLLSLQQQTGLQVGQVFTPRLCS